VSPDSCFLGKISIADLFHSKFGVRRSNGKFKCERRTLNVELRTSNEDKSQNSTWLVLTNGAGMNRAEESGSSGYLRPGVGGVRGVEIFLKLHREAGAMLARLIATTINRMIRLAFSTNAFKKHSLAEAVNAIAAAGYIGVELMADVPHAYPPSFDSQQRSALLHQLQSLHLTVSNINAFTLFALGDTYHPSWIEDDERLRETRIGHTLNCIELAAEFGAKTMSLQPGGPMIGTKITQRQAGERFAEGLRRVIPSAQRHGVTLAIEPEPGLFIETAAEYLEFKQQFFRDSPILRMNCDVGHLFCVGEDPAGVIRAMPEQIAHVHLEDIGKNRVHQHLTPGKGVIDFRSIFEAMEAIGYTGWVTVELYPYETTAEGVARLAIEHLGPLIT
jgi:sugar phosphate isomerase/epimerase